MTNFPTALDDDSTIYRIDDDLSELGTDAINQLRSAVFSIEQNIGLTAAGSLADFSTRFGVSFNPDGTIKSAALNGIGLVSLPITNNQVGTNAGIIESKLTLNYGTSYLYTLIQAQSVLLTSLSVNEAALQTELNAHIAGGPASNLRHTASMIDLNAVPSDSRDPSFVWPGLINNDGYQLTATNVATALEQVNNNLTSHQNQVKDAHAASAISVDTSTFTELLTSSESVQDVLDNIDQIELLQLGTHRATQHTNGVPKAARSLNLSSATTLGSDGYNIQVVGPTPCETFVAHNPPGTAPVDNVTQGDDILRFQPTSNAGSIFDAQFSQVKVGDVVRINYGTVEDIRRVESIRYIPGTEWTIRVNGVNLVDTVGYSAFARIDRPLYDSNTTGVLAVAAANPVPLANYSILGSVIIGDPRGATALGMNFNPAQITPKSCMLYLELYPTGNPADHVISLTGIDITGDLGASQGLYTIESIVTATNNSFRATGYNYRFIAYELNNNVGIMLADSVDGASFAIISGTNASGTLATGPYVNNVVGDTGNTLIAGYNLDPLGFGVSNANLASPAYQATWTDATAAQLPTKIMHPVKSRNYIVNGRPFDQFQPKEFTTNNFYIADIDSRTVTGSSVEVTYKINYVLDSAGFKAGKTILIQPAVAYTDPLYSDVDYGRFIIKSVAFNNCNCVNDYTLITVISGIHGGVAPISSSGAAGLPVRLYFDEGSAGFDDQNLIDASDTSFNYHRHHEIFVTDQKTTFTHERARLQFKSETSQLVDTNSWHITSVSPKFRGYVDGDGTLNKYIRLYFVYYNATSGEFDGYLGQRNTVTNVVTNPGITVRGRKNVPVKFFDDTNVDYIELEFRDESNAYPGLSLPANKWMDIELFSSLRLDQELLPLATCEVNWVQALGKNVVEFVKNQKAYGSISELEFTQSAVDFISAGDRYLHQNGVVAGFDNSGISGLGLYLHGGIALVNGKIITANAAKVVIPLAVNSTGASAQTINWAICVNDYGDIETHPLTPTKTQFFAKDTISGNSYYISSYSFSELYSKKTLLILYVATFSYSGSAGGYTFNSISDARRFSKNETALIPLTWAGKAVADTDPTLGVSDIVGHFTSFEQVTTWINNTQSPRNFIKIKGLITSNATLDLSKIKYPTVFDGSEGCLFALNAQQGMIITSNITLKNIDFTWSPGSLTYTSGDNVNLNSTGVVGADNSNACIYGLARETGTSIGTPPGSLKNVNIDNCTFTGTFPQPQRPPYIALIFDGANTVMDGIKITNNRFNDPSTVSNQCAIAIALLGIDAESAGSEDPALLNSLIENNVANNNQNIIVSMLAAAVDSLVTFICINVVISKNKVGAIGYFTTLQQINTNISDGFDLYQDRYFADSLLISGNVAMFIGCLDTTGAVFKTFSASSDLDHAPPSGNTSIINNRCSLIHCKLYSSVGNTNSSGPALIISQNKLNALANGGDSATALYSLYSVIISGYSTTSNFNIGIYVDGTQANTLGGGDGVSVDSITAQVTDNVVWSTFFDNIYDCGIFVDSCGALIRDNVVTNFNNYGIVATNTVNRQNDISFDIFGNKLYNAASTAQNYIVGNDAATSVASVKFTIINNFFDQYKTNGSEGFMIYVTDLTRAIVKDNINQTDSIGLRAIDFGKVVSDDIILHNNLFYDLTVPPPGYAQTDLKITSLTYSPTDSIETIDAQTLSQLNLTLTNHGSINWIIPITLLNKNVKFVSASVTFNTLFTPGSGSNVLTLSLIAKGGNDSVLVTNSLTASTSGTGSITITTTDLSNPLTLQYGSYLKFNMRCSTTSDTDFFVQDLIYTFRY